MTTQDLNLRDHTWVRDVLHEDKLELADAKRVQHYGRRHFSKDIRIVLWLLRIYVVLMMLIIFVQLWLGVHQ